MTEINIDLPDGATPIEPDDLADLIPAHIRTRRELNTFEAQNIRFGVRYVQKRGRRSSNILSTRFCLDLHKAMTDKTWHWAGEIRTREVSIGDCPPHMIRERLINVLDNASYWVVNKTFDPDEICARLHRNLVWIHPFKNVNGRHSRIMADLLAKSIGLKPFTWGGGRIMDQGTDRDSYLSALRLADTGDFSSLIDFMRS